MVKALVHRVRACRVEVADYPSAVVDLVIYACATLPEDFAVSE
jgi:hypothetical protein